jgi:hypothetical protein
VLILRQYAYRDAELVVIPQPDGSVACIPAWMTHESAARHQLGAEPRLSLDILRSVRAEIDALLSFSNPTQGWRTATMKRKSASIQPDLFEQNRPRVLLAPLHKERLAALVKALLLEIAAALASGKLADDQDHR